MKTIWYIGVVSLFCGDAALMAQSNIRVLKLPVGSPAPVDVTNQPFVSVDNAARTVSVNADSTATDWFIRQEDAQESIAAVEFRANPTNPGNTVYRVSVGASSSWEPEAGIREFPGASSLGSFTGFGTAGSTPTEPSYYVQLRVGVSGQLSNITTNEVVRVDAKRVSIGSNPAVWRIGGRTRTVSAGRINLNLDNLTWNDRTPNPQYDPDLSIPWPYNASQEERYLRGNVELLTTRDGHHQFYDDVNWNIDYNNDTISGVSPAMWEILPGSFGTALSNGELRGRFWAFRRVNVLEGRQLVQGVLYAGLGGDRIVAGALNADGTPSAGGNISGKFDYAHQFETMIANPYPIQDGDGYVRLIRAVSLDGVAGNFQNVLKARSLLPTSSLEDQVKFDGDCVGEISFFDGLPSDKLFMIGGNLSGNLYFGNAQTNVASPIAGQVIVNQANVGGILPSFSVRKNDQAVGGLPFYPATASDLGGGAIGLAPFALHVKDSFPETSDGPAQIRLWQFKKQSWARAYSSSRGNNLRSANSASDEGFIQTRFYGPVKAGAGNDPPLRVERFAVETNGWKDESDLFVSTTASSDPLNRDVRLSIDSTMLDPETFCTSSEYRIVRGNLVCNFVAGQPLAADFDFRFVILPELSPADLAGEGAALGGDGFHDNNDFIAFTDQFFNQTLLGDFAGSGGSFGPDGVWDNNDFIVFIQIFFEAPAALIGSCDDSDASPSVPFELPESLQTADAETDRQLNALWITLSRTNDSRVANRLIDTLFDGAQ